MLTIIGWAQNILLLLYLWNGIKIYRILKRNNKPVVLIDFVSSVVLQSFTQLPWSRKIPLIAVIGSPKTGSLYGLVNTTGSGLKWHKTPLVQIQDIQKLESILPLLEYEMEVRRIFFENSDKGLHRVDGHLYIQYMTLVREIRKETLVELKKMATFESNVLVMTDHEVESDVFKQKEAFDTMTKKVEFLTKNN